MTAVMLLNMRWNYIDYSQTDANGNINTVEHYRILYRLFIIGYYHSTFTTEYELAELAHISVISSLIVLVTF